ncbi:hypothetical protein EsH8_VII_000166 [Colletotrichum jinshuiense]
MKATKEFLRFASPNEQRTISREDLGYYHAVIIGAIYEVGDGLSLGSPSSLFGAVNRCIEQHPFLGVVVADRHTDKAYYQRAPVINLEDHVEVHGTGVETDSDYWVAIEEVLRSNLDRPFSHSIPPWRVVVLPITSSQYFVAFCFSHMIGDGPTGVTFHRSLLEAFRKPSAAGSPAPSAVKPPPTPLPIPFDTPERLPISWSFLLGPLIAVIVPGFISSLLGLKAHTSAVSDGTWTGPVAAFDPSHPEASRTKVAIRLIESPLVDKAIQEARKHDAKLTATLHQFIVRALSKTFADSKTTDFVGQTAINMRKSVGVPADEMGEFASTAYTVHPVTNASGPLSAEEWDSASSSTRKFAETAATLQDQPIGLLRYAPSIRKWLSGKLGQQRDCSYEVSNIGAFEDGDVDSAHVTNISHVVFSQPGHVFGAPLCFNFSSVKGGSVVYTVTWPTGALGVAPVEEEGLVDAICKSIQSDLEALG